MSMVTEIFFFSVPKAYIIVDICNIAMTKLELETNYYFLYFTWVNCGKPLTKKRYFTQFVSES